MKAIVEEDNIDTVVAVSGGSAVDTAKATAFYTGRHVVIIPTVAATDAPCTGLSVIYNDDHSFDKYLFYPTNPDAVLVDTTVIANAPAEFLIAGMAMRSEPSLKDVHQFEQSLQAWRVPELPVQVRLWRNYAMKRSLNTENRLSKLAKSTQ